MKALNNRVGSHFVIALALSTMTLVACGRAEMKSLRRAKSTESTTFRDENDKSSGIQKHTQMNIDAALRQQELDSQANGINAQNSILATTSAAALSAAQELANRIQNIDLIMTANKKAISILIKGKDTIHKDNFEAQEQELELTQSSDAGELLQYRAESRDLSLVLTLQNAEGLYTLQLQEKNGSSINAYIRLNSALIKKSDVSTSKNLDPVANAIIHSKVAAQIVQLYMPTGTEIVRAHLNSSANKIKLIGQSDVDGFKFIIRGLPSYTLSGTENTTQTVLLIKSNDSNKQSSAARSIEGIFAGGSAAGSIAFESYVQIATKADEYRKIVAGNPDNERAVDADIIRIVMKDKKSKKDSQDALILDVKFASVEQKLNEEAKEAQLKIEEETQVEANANNNEQSTSTQENESSSEEESSPVKQGDAKFEEGQMNRLLPPDEDTSTQEESASAEAVSAPAPTSASETTAQKPDFSNVTKAGSSSARGSTFKDVKSGGFSSARGATYKNVESGSTSTAETATPDSSYEQLKQSIELGIKYFLPNDK